MALEFHRAIADMLIKTMRAIDETGFHQVVIAGGVSANRYLRKRLDEAFTNKGVIAFYPPMAYCTDNAAMVAYTGEQYLERKQHEDLTLVYCAGQWMRFSLIQ